MTPRERAEKIILMAKNNGILQAKEMVAAQIEEAIEENQQTIEAGVSIRMYEKKYAEGFRAAREKAKGIAEGLRDEKQKCSPENKDHDIRWCPTCESMEDAYGVIAQRIKEMEP